MKVQPTSLPLSREPRARGLLSRMRHRAARRLLRQGGQHPTSRVDTGEVNYPRTDNTQPHPVGNDGLTVVAISEQRTGSELQVVTPAVMHPSRCIASDETKVD